MKSLRKAALALALAVAAASAASAQKADALALYRAGRYAESIAVCESELMQNPNNIDSYCVMCWSLVRSKRYAEAEAKAIEARKINSNDIRIIEILAESKYYLGKNAGALECFQLYLANAPQNSGDIGFAYYCMGEIYIRQARYQHADISLSMAVHVKPVEYAYWWTRCGYAREQAGALQSSLSAYNKALELDKSLAEAARGRDRVAAKMN